MKFASSGRIKLNGTTFGGNLDRRYSTVWGRTLRQQSAQLRRSSNNFWL
ncbi:hypothetical protein [Prochlorococcus sp. MIT 0916]